MSAKYSYDEFKDEILSGSELCIRYKGQEYAINHNIQNTEFYFYPFFQSNVGIPAAQYDDSNDQIFSSAKALLENVRIGGCSLEAIWDEVDKVSIC